MTAEVQADTGHGHDAAHGHDAGHAHHEEGFIKKYFFSTDHKIICFQYLFTGMAMAVIGGLAAYVFRMQIAFPGAHVPGWQHPVPIPLQRPGQ